MKGRIDPLLEGGIVGLCNPIELDKCAVQIIDDLTGGGFFGKEKGGTAEESLRISLVRRYERQDVLEEFLLASIVCDGGLESSMHMIGGC